MRFATAYALAYSVVQSSIAVTNRVAPMATQMDFFSLVAMVAYLFETVFCSPWGCNGIQPYEWVAAPLFIAATWLLLMRVRPY